MLIIYLQESGNNFHPSVCICITPNLPTVFPALMLHGWAKQGFPSSSSLFDFPEANSFTLVKKITRTPSHNFKMWGPFPVWGRDRAWGGWMYMVYCSGFELPCSAAAQRAGRTGAGQPVLLHVNSLLHISYHSFVFTQIFLLSSFDLRET